MAGRTPVPGMFRRATRGTALRGRPVAAVVLLAVSGAAVLLLPSSRLTVLVAPGAGGLTGLLVGVLLLGCAVTLVVSPRHTVPCGVAGLLLAVASLLTPSLGGLLLGTACGLVGGSLAVAWEPRDR
ncbi:hypothetical protein AD006_25160 [Pseudonocardia sp. EC080610-09]|uniref:DUF6114 domain-containing protein n=1 Tax=unclassified Pseudonocardia TaxID=2619320 RepID=UPI000706A67C|nr:MULTISPECIES: DUF6114 domain-containing protein [unclassified Pseudonocardia]ALL77774.1 hypothetical protein AD006_25160 [Pseudonocardia sp. EC080610-09]ALL80689.1 hypothetical protein AD017_04750 [Pseudonocardia sp. EC080619-01]